MRHHNYYNRGNWQPSWERGVIGFSLRRLSPSLGSRVESQGAGRIRTGIGCILLCPFATSVGATASASKHCQPPRNGRISMALLETLLAKQETPELRLCKKTGFTAAIEEEVPRLRRKKSSECVLRNEARGLPSLCLVISHSS